MYNWSVDLKSLNRKKEAAIIWKLEQSINFGLNKRKLSRVLVKKYWDKLRLDPQRKKVLQFLLWHGKS